jgi:hypothetical protein
MTVDCFWADISDAVELVEQGKAKRIDGDGYKVYVVPGGITRIDLPTKETNGTTDHQSR